MHAPNVPPITSELPGIAGDLLARMRARRPRVHCITNAVAQNFTANVLLAAGAIPSMTIAPDEIAEFVARADALLVNLGTFDAERRSGRRDRHCAGAARTPRPGCSIRCSSTARSRARPSPGRWLRRSPTAVRLNAAEFAALAGAPADDDDALRRYALDRRCVVALTGATDQRDRRRAARRASPTAIR